MEDNQWKYNNTVKRITLTYILYNSTSILVSIVMQIGLSEDVCNIVETHSNICK